MNNKLKRIDVLNSLRDTTYIFEYYSLKVSKLSEKERNDYGVGDGIIVLIPKKLASNVQCSLYNYIALGYYTCLFEAWNIQGSYGYIPGASLLEIICEMYG